MKNTSNKLSAILFVSLLLVFTIVSLYTGGFSGTHTFEGAANEQLLAEWRCTDPSIRVHYSEAQNAIIVYAEPGQQVCLEKTLVLDVSNGEYFSFITRSDYVDIILNGKQIYVYRTEDHLQEKGLFRYMSVPLPDASAGETCKLLLLSNSEGTIHIQYPHRNTAAGNYHYLLIKSAGTILICTTLLITVLAALVLFFYYIWLGKRLYELLYLAMFCLLSASWIIADSGVSVLLGGTALSRHYLYYGSFMLLPASYLLFMRQLTGSKLRLMNALIWSDLLFALAAMLLDIFGVLPMMSTSHIFMCIILITCVFGVVLLIRTRQPHALPFLLASIAMLLLVVVSMIYYILGKPIQVSLPYSYGMLVFSISLLVTLVRNAHRMELEANKSNLYLAQREDADALVQLTQINTHFFNNTMNAIRGLIRFDPDAAYKMVGDFCRFTRYQVSASNRKGHVVPFTEELKAIRAISDVYVVCKSGDLQVAYDIEADDFCIPTLTVEPFVENAIVHGISHGSGQGTVTIRAQSVPGGHLVTVSDDGCGFSPEDVSNSHSVGINNVRARLATCPSCTLKIDSSPGQGTTVTLFYPQELGENENEAHTG